MKIKLNCTEGLPPVDSFNEEENLQNEEILKKLHHILLEVEVLEGKFIVLEQLQLCFAMVFTLISKLGELECPETGRKFPIKNGIPNMLVTEDE